MNKGLVSFYVGAHPDDWQIFAGNHARNDIRNSKARVVFVYLTAGDAGHSDGWWESREFGAIASTLLLLEKTEAIQQEEKRVFVGRSIACRTIGDTQSYFLRLPDGCLTDLKLGKTSLTAVDGSAVYPDWNSLVRVVEAILDHESGSYLVNNPWVNTSDYLIDPFPWIQELDNPDHSATGDVIRAFAKGKYRCLYWAGYKDTRRRDWVSGEDFCYKRSLMIEYSRVVKEHYKKRGDYEEAEEFYDDLMRMTYARTESS